MSQMSLARRTDELGNWLMLSGLCCHMFSNITGSLKDAPQEERATWLDETKITAAERSWVQGCQSLRESASELLSRAMKS